MIIGCRVMLKFLYFVQNKYSMKDIRKYLSKSLLFCSFFIQHSCRVVAERNALIAY